MSDPITDFISDVSEYLANNGIGSITSPVDIFTSVLPATPDNAVGVIGVPALAPNAYIPELKFPRFQVLVRNDDYNIGFQKMGAIRSLLHSKFGIETTNYHSLYIWADQDTQPIGQDLQGRHMFSTNFRAEIRDLIDDSI